MTDDERRELDKRERQQELPDETSHKPTLERPRDLNMEGGEDQEAVAVVLAEPDENGDKSDQGQTEETFAWDEIAKNDDNYLGEDTFKVEAIRAKRTRKGVQQYLIKWEGYESEENTWEPADNVNEDLIDAWNESVQSGKKTAASNTSDQATRRFFGGTLPLVKKQKLKKKADEIFQDESSDWDDIAPSVSDEKRVAEQVPKKRGRPKGSKNKPKPLQDDADKSDLSGSQTVSKGRGRPKGSKNKPEIKLERKEEKKKVTTDGAPAIVQSLAAAVPDRATSLLDKLAATPSSVADSSVTNPPDNDASSPSPSPSSGSNYDGNADDAADSEVEESHSVASREAPAPLKKQRGRPTGYKIKKPSVVEAPSAPTPIVRPSRSDPAPAISDLLRRRSISRPAESASEGHVGLNSALPAFAYAEDATSRTSTNRPPQLSHPADPRLKAVSDPRVRTGADPRLKAGRHHVCQSVSSTCGGPGSRVVCGGPGASRPAVGGPGAPAIGGPGAHKKAQHLPSKLPLPDLPNATPLDIACLANDRQQGNSPHVRVPNNQFLERGTLQDKCGANISVTSCESSSVVSKQLAAMPLNMTPTEKDSVRMVPNEGDLRADNRPVDPRRPQVPAQSGATSGYRIKRKVTASQSATSQVLPNSANGGIETSTCDLKEYHTHDNASAVSVSQPSLTSLGADPYLPLSSEVRGPPTSRIMQSFAPQTVLAGNAMEPREQTSNTQYQAMFSTAACDNNIAPLDRGQGNQLVGSTGSFDMIDKLMQRFESNASN